jgi:hypothetical protein
MNFSDIVLTILFLNLINFSNYVSAVTVLWNVPVLYIEDALEYHKRALAIFEDLDDKVWMAQDYGDIAIVLKHMGSLEEARESVSQYLNNLRKRLAITILK